MKKYMYAIVVCALILGGVVLALKLVQPIPKRNVIVILVDTLRADHLGYMGYSRDTSPNIDALAKQSVIFTNAFATSSWTAPTVASVFTGLYPSIHGLMPPNSRVKAAQKFSFRLSREINLLPEIFHSAGYKTAGISSNEWISEQFGFNQGFDYFFMSSRMIGQAVNDKAKRILEKIFKKDQPFFFYVHYMDPHDPYMAPGEYRDYFKGPNGDTRYNETTHALLTAYDNEIRYVDSRIGQLIEQLKAAGIFEDSFIVFTADHGEQFKERGNIGHGYTLLNEEIHIPLFIKYPNSSRVEVIDHPVSQVDILPTLAEANGIALTSKVNGINILDPKFTAKRDVLTEVSRIHNFKAVIEPSLQKIVAAYQIEKGLYVNPKEYEEVTFYNLKSDPLEAASQPATEEQKGTLTKDFEDLLLNYEKYKVDTLEMTPDTLEELKSLGYF